MIFINDEHPLKDSSSIDVTDEEIVICVNDLQSLNEPFPIDVTDEDNITCDNDKGFPA